MRARPAPFQDLSIAFGSTRTVFACAALCISTFKTPSFKVAVTFSVIFRSKFIPPFCADAHYSAYIYYFVRYGMVRCVTVGRGRRHLRPM